jgi:hypothetical protein
MRINFYLNDKLVGYGSHTMVGGHDLKVRFTEDGERELTAAEMAADKRQKDEARAKL